MVGNLVLLFWRVKDQRHHIKMIIDTIIDVKKTIKGKSTLEKRRHWKEPGFKSLQEKHESREKRRT